MEKDNKNNTGNINSGDWNSGNRNSGNINSGYSNSGDSNSGDWNSGNRNSGNRNSGNINSGDWNSGDRNSGNRNSGNINSGDWNSGDRNSGYFNINQPKVRIFGKETDVRREDIDFPDWLYFNLTEWINFGDMTDKEKEDNAFAKFTKGYLKTYEYKEAFKKSFDDEEDLNEIKKVLDLPNFDYDIFEEISGISKADFEKKLNKNLDSKDEFIEVNGKKYKLVE